MKLFLASAVIFSISFLSSCGFQRLKDLGPESSAINYKIDQIGYKEVSELVINPSCVACHNQSVHKGSVALDSFAAVKANLGLVQNEVVGKSMPPDSPLPDDRIKLVSDWIQNGAPEFATQVATPTPSPSPTATPSPTPTGLIATYVSIRANVFLPKCLSCHSAGSSQRSLPLDNYEKMMADSWMIKAGNPGKSTVYTEIAAKAMPPRNRNAVTAQELSVIKTWIENGAPKGE